MDPRIEEYIRANRRTYTREAIRQQLIEAGHDPAAIDATWEMLHAPDPDEAGVAGEGFWGRFFLVLLGINVAVLLLVALGTGMLGNLPAYGVVLIVLAVALGIGALISWGIVAAVGPEKLGRTTAMVVGAVVPAVFAVLIGGTCYALIGAIGPPPPPAINGTIEVDVQGAFEYAASGQATCQPQADGRGFFVYSQGLPALDDREVMVSVNRFSAGPEPPAEGPTPAPEPGAADPGELSIHITLIPLEEPAEEVPPPIEWSNQPGSEIDGDIASNGLSGSITFSGLRPIDFGEPLPSGQLDGSVTWTCG